MGKVRAYRHQDLCVVAMILKIRLEAKINDNINKEMMDYIIGHQMKDGGSIVRGKENHFQNNRLFTRQYRYWMLLHLVAKTITFIVLGKLKLFQGNVLNIY